MNLAGAKSRPKVVGKHRKYALQTTKAQTWNQQPLV